MAGYDWYHAALAGKQPPIVESQPQPGFYRYRRGDELIPVAIWYDPDEHTMVALAGDADETSPAEEFWMDVARKPIREHLYRARMETGRWLDDIPESPPKNGAPTDAEIDRSQAAIAAVLGPDVVAELEADGLRSVGAIAADVVAETFTSDGKPRSNQPPDDENASPYVDSKKLAEATDTIDSAVLTANAFKLPITDDDKRNSAQALRSRLLELKTKVEKVHEKTKAPHWEICKTIDNAWLPLAKKAEKGAKRMREAIDAYETEQLRQRRAREAADEAEKRRKEAIAKEPDGPELPAALVRAEEAPAPEPEARAPIKGAYGRAASAGVYYHCTVTVWDDVFRYFRANEELRALLEKLAQAATNAGETVPGTITEERVKTK